MDRDHDSRGSMLRDIPDRGTICPDQSCNGRTIICEYQCVCTECGLVVPGIEFYDVGYTDLFPVRNSSYDQSTSRYAGYRRSTHCSEVLSICLGRDPVISRDVAASIVATLRASFPSDSALHETTRLHIAHACTNTPSPNPPTIPPPKRRRTRPAPTTLAHFGRRCTQLRYLALGRLPPTPSHNVIETVACVFGVMENHFMQFRGDLGDTRRNFPHYTFGIFLLLVHLDTPNFLFYCQSMLPLYKTIDKFTRIKEFYYHLFGSCNLVTNFPPPRGLTKAHLLMTPSRDKTDVGNWGTWREAAEYLVLRNSFLMDTRLIDPATRTSTTVSMNPSLLARAEQLADAYRKRRRRVASAASSSRGKGSQQREMVSV